MQPLYNPSCLNVQGKSLSELLAGLELPAETIWVEPQHTASPRWAPIFAAQHARRAASVALPLPANDDAGTVPDLVTRRARRQRRRSGLRQREDAAQMRALKRPADAEVVEHLPLSKPHNDNVQTKPRRGLASWDDAGDLPRVIAINGALVTFGRPFAVSINLDPAIIARACNDDRGPMDYLWRLVDRHVKRGLGAGREMWLALETDDDGRSHLHGGIAGAANDDPWDISRILAKAGGNWTRPGSAPAFLRDQLEHGDPDGWPPYVLKRPGRTKRALRELCGLPDGARVTLWASSRNLRVEGKRLHAQARQAAKEAHQRPVVVEAPQPAPATTAPASDPQKAPAPAVRPGGGLAAVSRAMLPVPVRTARLRHVLALCPRFVIRSARLPGLIVHNQTNHGAGLLRPSAFARSRGPPRSIKAD